MPPLEITETQVMAELGRLHMENLALRARLDMAMARIAELERPAPEPGIVPEREEPVTQ